MNKARNERPCKRDMYDMENILTLYLDMQHMSMKEWSLEYRVSENVNEFECHSIILLTNLYLSATDP